MNNFNLDRFIKAQERDYNTALAEIKTGKKQSHWIWYIFPQIKGLGHSETAQYYSIQSIDEAKAYWNNEYLHNHLIEICRELLNLKSNNISEIMGFPDDLKLCSSMTLFYFVAPEEKVFKQVIDKFYNSRFDENTIRICEKVMFENIKLNEQQINQIHYAIKDDIGSWAKEHQQEYNQWLKKQYIKSSI